MKRIKSVQPFQLFNRWQVVLLLTILLQVTLGLIFMLDISLVESASTFGDPYFLFNQYLSGLLLGGVAFVLGLILKPSTWLKIGLPLFIVSIILLLLVFVPGIGLHLNGASRWLSLGPLRLQPVELLKIAIPFYFASLLVKRQSLIQIGALLFIPAVAILLQPDLGSLLIVTSITITLFFFAGGSYKHLAGIGLAGIPLLILLIILSPYRFQRLATFFNPESDPLGASFHIRQITLALGRGGLWGQGIGNSQQKFSYIPESTTDSIFAIIAEEIGFFGSLLIIFLFFFQIVLLYKILSFESFSKQEQLLGFGLLTLFSVQVILNLSAVVGLVPLTGVPLPFYSYGRSSQIVIFLLLGILVRMGRYYKS